MSDPAWTSRDVIAGSDTIIYIQAAGTTASPGTADELGFSTGVSFGNEAATAEKGPYINSAQKKKTIDSYSASAETTVDVAEGADAARNRFFTAITGKTKVKFTVIIGDESTGEIHVFDQCIVGFNGEIDPASGTTYTFTMDADSYAHTAATA